MNDLTQLHYRFLQECPDLSDERWQGLMASAKALSRQATTGAMEMLLEELASLNQKAAVQGNEPDTRLLDLPAILAWRLRVYFRDAAVALEEGCRPESMEAGWDEQMDLYRELWGD